MVSRPGKQTIATFLCFSNGVKVKEPEEIDDLDPTKVDKNIEDLNRQIELENAQIERDQTHHIRDNKIENLVETPSHKPKPDPIESTVVNEFSGQGQAKKQDIE